MAKSLKEQTTSAIFWSFMDKGGQQLFQFAFLFILARLLFPEETGLIAVLAIFVAIANLLQESGFSSALIRKKDADESDYSTVFYFNIAISFIIYTILFIAAPWIAIFYKQPILADLSRFLFLVFIFNAFGIIQNIHLVKRMDFKTNAKISLSASLVSGIIATLMAYYGYGVWSLAVQQVLQAFLRSSLLWLSVKWHPKARFNIERLKAIYNYSFKLLLNSLFNQIAGNITSIVMGKKFEMADAGNYSQGTKLGIIPQSVIASSLSGVAFPLLNNIGDDIDRKNRVFRKIVRVISFVCFPLAVFTFVAADSLVLVLLKERWAEVIPMLRIIAIGSSVVPLLYALTSLLQSLGKSGLLLTMESTRNVLTILAVLISSRYGINPMIWCVSIMSLLTFVGEYYVAGKTINYKIIDVIKDVSPYILLAVTSFTPSYILSYYVDNNLIRLILQAVLGGTIYFGLSKTSGSKVMDDLLNVIRGRKLI